MLCHLLALTHRMSAVVHAMPLGKMIDCPYVLPLPHCFLFYFFFFSGRTNRRNINNGIWNLVKIINSTMNNRRNEKKIRIHCSSNAAHAVQENKFNKFHFKILLGVCSHSLMERIHLANRNSSLFSYLILYFLSFLSCHREKQLNERDFDFISNWHHFNAGTAAVCHQSTNNTMMDTKTRMEMKVNSLMGGRSQSKPHTGLLRRRHSLPEIIMRK